MTEREHALRRETDNILAYENYLIGLERYRRFTPDDLGKAVSYFKKAIELDPNYSRAHAAMALAYWRAFDMSWGWSLSVGWEESLLWARH